MKVNMACRFFYFHCNGNRQMLYFCLYLLVACWILAQNTCRTSQANQKAMSCSQLCVLNFTEGLAYFFLFHAENRSF